MKTRLVRNDAEALALVKASGAAAPSVFVEDERGGLTRAVSGYVVQDERGEARGYLLLASSDDGEDYEIHANGGWCLSGARDFFRWLFGEAGQVRVSARCKAVNERNIRVLQRMGFKQEGRKRLPDGDVIFFGMFREECRFLKGV